MSPFFHRLGRQLHRVPVEAVVWTAGLVALACTNPEAEALIEACVSKWLFGISCPGCGLGHAVAYLFRGEIALSVQTHPFGPLAIVILLGRVVGLVRTAFIRPLSPFELT